MAGAEADGMQRPGRLAGDRLGHLLARRSGRARWNSRANEPDRGRNEASKGQGGLLQSGRSDLRSIGRRASAPGC